MRRREYFDEIRQDVRFGLRHFLKNPGFACVAILTLALGIGATTAIFSAVRAVVLQPLPLDGADRVVDVFGTFQGGNRASLSPGNFTEVRRRSTVFEAFAVNRWGTVLSLADGDTTEQIDGAEVSGDYFAVLGVRAALGRAFTVAEDQPGRDGVVVLSHRLWTRRFGADPGVVGRDVRVSGRPRTVLGVMPASLDLLPSAAELWIPLALTSAQQAQFHNHLFGGLARLKPGVSLERARAQLEGIARQLAEEHPVENAERGFDVAPFVESVLGPHPQRLFVLLGAVGFVLLIACGNVANLLLARGAVRRPELAVRAALGAGRGRLVRQLLTESVLLAAFGAAGGLFVAGAGLRALVALSPPGVPRLGQAHLDPVTLAFAAAVAIASSLIFGVVPAWRATRDRVQDALRGGRSGGMGASRDRLRGALVALEVALALVLLVGSGLLIRTALALDAVDPGFDARGLFSARLTLPREAYADDLRIRQALDRLIEETRAMPGVSGAAIASQVPFAPGGYGNGLIPEGRPLEQASRISAFSRLVSPGFHETMRVPIVAGRAFTDQDRRGAPKVMIVSEAFARLAWPDETAPVEGGSGADASAATGSAATGSAVNGVAGQLSAPAARYRHVIGRRVACCEAGSAGQGTDFKVIVGVAGDVRAFQLGASPGPAFYLPIAQAPLNAGGTAWDLLQRTVYVVARTPGDPATLTSGVMRVLRGIDADVPLFNVRTMEERVSAATATARFNTALLTTLGAIGLVLAVVGIYGVIAYFVSQRTQEIGVRLALGATPTDVVRLAVGQALKPVLAGLVSGVGGAILASDLLATQLYGVTPRDPLTIACVSAGFVLVAVLASWFPARRAARIDPTRALNAT